MHTIDGEVTVNLLYLYENGQAEANQTFEELSLPGDPKLASAKRQFRSDHRYYEDVLNNNQVTKNTKTFEKEIWLASHSH